MIVKNTSLKGLLTIEPKCFNDERGFFLETYHEKRYKDNGISDSFIQENHSRSSKGVLRGLHYQKIRSSIGIAANVFTTIGPLSFTLAQDLSKDSGDVSETFNFRLGTSF